MRIKTIPYLVVYILLLNFLLPYAISADVFYHKRLPYPLIVNNPRNIDPVIKFIKNKIDHDNAINYIIILGDSVFYGSPGNSDQSISAYLEQMPEQPLIFNLSFPGSQLGDLYTMLLMLDKHGISTDHVILNIRYASFVLRDPYQSTLAWWAEDLRKLEPTSFLAVKSQLKQTDWHSIYKKPYEWLQDVLNRYVYSHVNLMSYKDYYQKYIGNKWDQWHNRPMADDSLSQPEPWYIKDPQTLSDMLHWEQLKVSFSELPLNLSETNPDVFFIRKIILHQKGKNTWVVMTGTNHELMKDFVNTSGYVENMKRLDNFLSKQPVHYLNLEGQVPDQLFTDFTHLMPDGYRMMAQFIWDAYLQRGATNSL
ncbi:hypothetical protein QFZ77_007371 [Paenibacillus sp. V4I3]|uniref:hypothetical protein n=1 Tax=unclassified Paenibacillus TaxID=185978 RepID=UPI00278293E5|nr:MULTISPECIES: hypothetical protein [unclassified Paenibacillus]MDQ0878712.1 hypothetical protein [Paenibacillus sp. V4I3]MDQ0885432.1 hypothetical protein [Paenibacillus sp. V4I9]